MKSKIIPILLTCACASLARADFNPVVLTPDSYTYDIVVEASAPQSLPDCINVTAGNGISLGDNTYYEQGLHDRPGTPGGNSGIPPHNTIFTNINNPDMTFLMPPDYTVNNELMVDTTFSSGTLLFSTPTTATNLAILCCGGGGEIVVNYTVTHADSSVETGTLDLLDWFHGGDTVAWGANGRIADNGTYNNYNSSAVNNNPPYLYADVIPVSDASPVTSVTFDTPSDSDHANFFAVSADESGTAWTPVPLDPSSFNVMGIVPASFPVTATMDQGTNTVYNGNLATWFEQGFDRSAGASGVPPSGSTFDSLSQPTHHYQMGDYSANNAILIDTNHQVANITPAAPASYTAFAFLTAGGDVGSQPMTNVCILQHQDGVNETNEFLGFDWYDNNHPGAIAWKSSGRIEMGNRTLTDVGNNYPYLFETYFLLEDTTSPVTNIVVQYKTAGASDSTTYVMAISAATGGIPPVVSSGPVPTSQTLNPGTNATFTVGTTGTQPITGYWQVEKDGAYYPLTDGLDANGSTIIGSQTPTLTISNLFVTDSTNYQYVANNAYGTGLSPEGTLIVSPQLISITPAAPTVYTSNNIPLAVNLAAGPAVSLQWYYIDLSGTGVTNLIAGATNATYTITNAPLALSGYTYGVIAANIYGTNSAGAVLAISDSAAFIGTDLPTTAETYAGASVTYSAGAEGNSPISYQWIVNGSVVNGADSDSYTLPATCGTTTVQVVVSNALSGGVSVASSVSTLYGDPNPTNITFNTDGAGWQFNTNGAGELGIITNNTLVVTDGNGSEASSAFFKTAQYLGSAWTASFTYNSHGGSADGTAFVLQSTNATALGGPGGQLGYGGGAVNPSIAFEINLYNGNGETPGIGAVTNGVTGTYVSALPVDVNSSDDINVKLDWNNGVLAASLVDAVTGDTYTTNYTYGSLVPILGGNIAYIGFSGGDGGATSVQTISNFSFHSVLPAVNLSASPVTDGSFTLTWPVDSSYVLQTTASLSSPSWGDGPVPTVVNGMNQITVDVNSGSSQQFYRLVRVVCQ